MGVTRQSRIYREKLFSEGKSKCSKCKEIKELKYFGVNTQSKNGHSFYCKLCKSIKGIEEYNKKKGLDATLSKSYKSEAEKQRALDGIRAYRDMNRNVFSQRKQDN